MKTLHVGMGWFSEEAGGLSRYSSGLVEALDRRGDRSRILVTGTERVSEASRGLAAPFAGKDAPMPRRLLGARKAFRHEMASFQPDVCAFHFALYARPMVDLVRGRPWVCHFHGPWAQESAAEGASRLAVAFKQGLVERPVYRAAPRLITLSRHFAGILRDSFGVAEGRLRVVPGGFDPTPFRSAPSAPRAREILGLPSDRPLLVCVRRLAHRMGLENLVDAIALLRRDVPDVLLAIAGKGPLTSDLARRIEERSLTENVKLLGFVPDEHLPALYASAALSVVPTVSLEGFGLVVAESLAAGTPVVSTRAGALPELLEGFSPQLLSGTPASADLAETLRESLLGRVPLPEAGTCRQHAEQWAWDRVTPRLLEIYREARESWG